MGNEVDYYDVQGMIRDARSEIRGEIDTAIRELRTVLREDIDYLHEDLKALERMVQSRTDHLV